MSLLFDIVRSRCAGFRITPAFLFPEPTGEPLRPRSEKRYGFVQALMGGIRTFGAERVVAYKIEAY
jgi:hypothetical protein